MASVITLAAGKLNARISTRGGCILQFETAGVPLLRPSADNSEAINSACYPLVPFGNRVRDNRFVFQGSEYVLQPNTDWDRHYLHGEGWRSDWKIESQSEDALTLSHVHEGSSLPYQYKARQTFTLGSGQLALSLSVTNIATRAMPFGIGWHPYFPMTPETRLQTTTGRMWTEEPGWLPGQPVELPQDVDFSSPRELPHHWVNNGFEGWSGKANIKWPERGTALLVEADPIFQTMFLFVSDTSFDPSYKRDYFALEPMSHLADGHNQPDLGGLVILAPGETLAGTVRLTVEAL